MVDKWRGPPEISIISPDSGGEIISLKRMLVLFTILRAYFLTVKRFDSSFIFDGKISKKWVRNIRPKNSEVPYLNEYCSDRFRGRRNRLLSPICIQNQVTVFYFSPAPPLMAHRAAGICAWISKLYSGARRRILKQCFNTLKMCSMTFQADAWQKLKSSFLFRGLQS